MGAASFLAAKEERQTLAWHVAGNAPGRVTNSALGNGMSGASRPCPPQARVTNWASRANGDAVSDPAYPANTQLYSGRCCYLPKGRGANCGIDTVSTRSGSWR